MSLIFFSPDKFGTDKDFSGFNNQGGDYELKHDQQKLTEASHEGSIWHGS